MLGRSQTVHPVDRRQSSHDAGHDIGHIGIVLDMEYPRQGMILSVCGQTQRPQESGRFHGLLDPIDDSNGIRPVLRLSFIGHRRNDDHRQAAVPVVLSQSTEEAQPILVRKFEIEGYRRNSASGERLACLARRGDEIDLKPSLAKIVFI